MTIAILVRHGESETNIRNIVSSDIHGYPLTEKGRLQARRAGEQLSGIGITGFRTSPVQRAIETSGIIAEEIHMSPEVDNRIIESEMGKFNNMPIAEIPKIDRRELGIETWESHQERLLKALDEARGITLMVSHAFPIRTALAHYLGLGELESYGIDIRYATISVIDLEKAEVLAIGSRYLSQKVRDEISGLL